MGDGLGERMAESGSRLSIEFNLARGGLGKYGDVVVVEDVLYMDA